MGNCSYVYIGSPDPAQPDHIRMGHQKDIWEFDCGGEPVEVSEGMAEVLAQHAHFAVAGSDLAVAAQKKRAAVQSALAALEAAKQRAADLSIEPLVTEPVPEAAPPEPAQSAPEPAQEVVRAPAAEQAASQARPQQQELTNADRNQRATPQQSAEAYRRPRSGRKSDAK